MATPKEVAQARKQAKFLGSLFDSLAPILGELDEISGFAKTVTTLEQAAAVAKADEASARAAIDDARAAARKIVEEANQAARAIAEKADAVKAAAAASVATAEQSAAQTMADAKEILAAGKAKAGDMIAEASGRLEAIEGEIAAALARKLDATVAADAAETKLANVNAEIARVKARFG